MKRNVGSTDKIIRLLLAATFVLLYLFNVVSGVFGYVMLSLAVVLILTSLVGFCPLYTLVNGNTRSEKDQAAK